MGFTIFYYFPLLLVYEDSSYYSSSYDFWSDSVSFSSISSESTDVISSLVYKLLLLTTCTDDFYMAAPANNFCYAN